MPFIRQYQATDLNEVVHIFNETAAPDLRAGGEIILDLACHIWCRPYLMLRPETCFVLDDDHGRAVGYILAALDTRAYVQSYKEVYIPHLISEGYLEPGVGEPSDWDTNLPSALKKIMHTPEGALHREAPDLIDSYPGHLHIDVLAPYQRHGWGRRLIERILEIAKRFQTPGIHLIMAASNQEAKIFYPKVGFSRFPQILDNGESGEEGRDKTTIWFVKSL
ncbi:hypothetical protein LTR84_007571 [Exophiala bonariae]|uniref:N-acetyltransferase domain-containing protein n=1 Tax=Exophiala bonariae TaxID=1690606 RepID=A0AAV9NKT5_9EURO|nr:hypothetical protein LTR84_007571 [Exophiala bonariae]